MPTKKELELQIKELKEENQLYLTTILKVLYEDLDGELTGPGNHDSNGTALHSLYGNLRYQTFNSDLKQDLTNFLKYYAEKVEDAESRWFEIIELKEEIEKLKEENEKLQEGNKKRFDKIKGLEYELKQEKEKKPDEPIVIKDSDIKRANKNLSKQLETEKDKVNQVLTALECWKEENTKLQEEIKHKDEKFYEFCEENKKIREENDKLKNTIENLKKHYETDLMEWKGKNKSLQDMLDLYIEASN